MRDNVSIKNLLKMYIACPLGIPKIWGDIFGVAMFSVMLGLGRTLYAKIGKNINKIIILGFIGCVVCYFTAAVSNIAIIGLIACAFTGFCASMLWPGNLIVASERFPKGGVFIFALMAAGGDLGASVGPQLVGIVTDLAIENTYTVQLSYALNITPEQLGMKLGILVGMFFPLMAFLLFKNFYEMFYSFNNIIFILSSFYSKLRFYMVHLFAIVISIPDYIEI